MLIPVFFQFDSAFVIEAGVTNSLNKISLRH